MDGPVLERGVEHVREDSGLGQQDPGGHRLVDALGGEAAVDPARELVGGVPGGLAVAEEDECGHPCSPPEIHPKSTPRSC